MRLSAAIVGDLRKVLVDEVRAGERAAMTTIRAETDQVKAELRRQVTTARCRTSSTPSSAAR